MLIKKVVVRFLLCVQAALSLQPPPPPRCRGALASAQVAHSVWIKKQSLHIQTIESMTIYLLIWTRGRETRHNFYHLSIPQGGDFRYTSIQARRHTNTLNTQHTTLFIMQNYKLFFKLFMNLSGIVFSLCITDWLLKIVYILMSMARP